MKKVSLELIVVLLIQALFLNGNFFLALSSSLE